MLQETLALLDPTLSNPQSKMNEGDTSADELDVNQGMESSTGDSCEGKLGDTIELQLNELREARIRAAQMEKTMRWWSDCTANWRDKWGKVKGERNKAREEIKALKVKLDSASQEIYSLKRDRNESSHLGEENAKLRKDVQKMEAELRRDRRAFVPPLRVGDGSSAGGNGETNSTDVTAEPEPLKCEERQSADGTLENYPRTEGKYIVNLHDLESERDCDAVGNPAETALSAGSITLSTKAAGAGDDDSEAGDDNARELVSLKDKLEKAEKEVSEEKRAKEGLVETVDEMKAEIDHLKGNVQEETIAKEKAINEINRLKDEEKRVSKPNFSSSSSYSKENVDRRMRELRVEIEKLQKENSSEWNKREKLETEKLTAERENKKIRHQLTDLENELRTKVNETSQAISFDFKQIQNELEDKKRELADSKATNTKLKRMYQDKKEDVLHTKTRVDQHEDEIKKLRARIDELKQKLTSTEDEVDQKENLARKLQRSLDEQTQQCHILRVQMEHLQSRWKKMTSIARAPKRGEKSGSADDDVFLGIDDY